MKKQLVISLKILVVLTILTGILYTMLITCLGQLFFPDNANGSLVIRNGHILGSRLIGQQFDSTRYFWTRPSATDYNPLPSSASNLGPTSKILLQEVEKRHRNFILQNYLTDTTTVPEEMEFASASGLDPDISPTAARMQVSRIVMVRQFNTRQKKILLKVIENKTEKPQFSIFGEPRINVFTLNLALDSIR